MIPVKTKHSNLTLVAEGCGDLPATLVINSAGQEELETCWELSDDDLKHIIENRKIYLYTMGRTVPPMLITSESLIEEAEKGSVT